MLAQLSRFSIRALQLGFAFSGALSTLAQASDIALLTAPVKVTASLHALDEGGYAAQIGVYNANAQLAQLVGTVVRSATPAAAERTLRQQVLWRAPYLFVHSSCGGGNAWRCEGEVVFKVSDGHALRLGDIIGTPATIWKNGRFYDVYDKLENQIATLSHATSPSFTIALDDSDSVLKVNAAATWSGNAVSWNEQAERIATLQPQRDWGDAQWEPYFAAVVGNAVLARYCDKRDELQQLLTAVNPKLDSDHRRLLADTLSKVVPLERPKGWRTPY